MLLYDSEKKRAIYEFIVPVAYRDEYERYVRLIDRLIVIINEHPNVLDLKFYAEIKEIESLYDWNSVNGNVYAYFDRADPPIVEMFNIPIRQTSELFAGAL